MFFVMDEDYWSTLAQVNANDVVGPMGITFGNDNPTQVVGGHSVAGKITREKYLIPAHGLRLVDGGTPFAISDATDAKPFGVFTRVKAGKVVAMGEGMVSLYMTSWQGVTNYECARFMGDVFSWLLQ